MAQQSPRTVNLTYHPGGTGTSPSLRRARKPFRLGNAAIGVSLLAFTIGVYTYSIAAVKQDDFSDVEDLLPPLHARAGLRSIEDEERDQVQNQLLSGQPQASVRGGREVPQTSSPSALSPGIPSSSSPDLLSSTSASASTPSTMPGSPISTSWFRRLDELSWVRKAGLVESGTGNVLVWGAPNVDNIGRLGDRVDPKGRTRGI